MKTSIIIFMVFFHVVMLYFSFVFGEIACTYPDTFTSSIFGILAFCSFIVPILLWSALNECPCFEQLCNQKKLNSSIQP
jgi:hypothetical protein